VLETLGTLERFYLAGLIGKHAVIQISDDQIAPLSEEIRNEFWKSLGILLTSDEMKELITRTRDILREDIPKE